jgi:hypothetical protein
MMNEWDVIARTVAAPVAFGGTGDADKKTPNPGRCGASGAVGRVGIDNVAATQTPLRGSVPTAHCRHFIRGTPRSLQILFAR